MFDFYGLSGTENVKPQQYDYDEIEGVFLGYGFEINLIGRQDSIPNYAEQDAEEYAKLSYAITSSLPEGHIIGVQSLFYDSNNPSVGVKIFYQYPKEDERLYTQAQVEHLFGDDIELRQGIVYCANAELYNKEDATNEENFRKSYVLISREDIITHIQAKKDNIKKIISKKKKLCHTSEYYNTLFDLFDRFVVEVQKIDLVHAPNDFWGYKVVISNYGINLFLEKYELLDPVENIWYSTTSVLFLKEEAKKITLKEFAEKNNIAYNTVKQWLRRCKIPSATKQGRRWYISELTDRPDQIKVLKKEYNISQLKELPDNIKKRYPHLENAWSVEFEEKAVNGQYSWNIMKTPWDIDHLLCTPISKEEKEELEWFFINSPDVTYNGEGPLVDLR